MTEIEVLAKEINLKIDNALQNVNSKADALEFTRVKESIENLVKKEDMQGLEKTLNEITDAVKRLQDAGESNEKNLSPKEQIKKSLLKNTDFLNEIKAGKKGVNGSLTIKAPVSMTFATNTTGTVGRREQEAGFFSLLPVIDPILEVVDVSTTNARHYTWLESRWGEGAPEMTAEGTLKAQGDLDISEKMQTPKKQTLIVTVSTEMLDDIDGLAEEIYRQMTEQMMQFYKLAIMNGDGTGNNISGLLDNAIPFTAGAFASAVSNPIIADVIRVAINQVILNNDIPTSVLLNPTDLTLMELEKGTNGHYVLPPFVASNGLTIKGIAVKESTQIAQNTCVVGNFSRFRIKVREDLNLEEGYKTGDFEKNLRSFKTEMRYFGFIPTVHYGSIVYISDLDAAKTLIEKP